MEPVELVIERRERSIGSHTVGRLLPAPRRRTVGPFIFLDHMGPWDAAPGRGFDVLPHPHIGLSTVTFLFEGEAVHRDSLGVVQPIRPGDVNWMTAGRGIVHSERSSDEGRARGGTLHGLQIWVALPAEAEDCAPEFHHHAAKDLPEWGAGGARGRVIAGSAFGFTSPVRTHSRLFYADARLDAGAILEAPPQYAERALYVVEGAVEIGGVEYRAGRLPVLAAGVEEVRVRALAPSRVALFGGDPLDGPRFIEWNFVAGARDRIERAKEAWREQRFPRIPGDDREHVPLPSWP